MVADIDPLLKNIDKKNQLVIMKTNDKKLKNSNVGRNQI
jgi:hypothetical protein